MAAAVVGMVSLRREVVDIAEHRVVAAEEVVGDCTETGLDIAAADCEKIVHRAQEPAGQDTAMLMNQS